MVEEMVVLLLLLLMVRWQALAVVSAAVAAGFVVAIAVQHTHLWMRQCLRCLQEQHLQQRRSHL